MLNLLFTTNSLLALEPFDHEYKSTFAGFGAKSRRSLTQLEDGTWELRMVSRNMLAKYEEVSHFKLDADGYPIPLENRFEGRLFGSKRKEVTQFDWDKGIATWTRKGETRTAELQPGMVDRILYQLLVPLDAEKGTELASYSFVNRGKARVYNFERLGTETIKIGGREIETIKMRRVNDNQEKQTSLWLAPELDYQLVKIHHRDKGGADYKMELKLK